MNRLTVPLVLVYLAFAAGTTAQVQPYARAANAFGERDHSGVQWHASPRPSVGLVWEPLEPGRQLRPEGVLKHRELCVVPDN